MDSGEILKSYLVSIGFHTDDPSFNQLKRTLKSVSDEVNGFSGSTTSAFGKAAVGFTSFIVTVNAGIAKFLSDLGQADLQTNILARRFWMSTDAAKAYQSSLSALGVSLQDLYLSPELMQRYKELQQQAFSMQLPDKDLEPAMKNLRDLTFQFQRLKLEGTYALQWIGFYLTKYLAPILGQSELSMKNINDIIQRNMPEWSAKVAQIASWFVRLGAAAWDARGALMAIMAIFMAPKLISMATNPVFLMIAGLTTLLLLLDDYKTYEKGGKSAFNWKWLDDLGDKLKKAGVTFDDFKGPIKDLGQSIHDLATAFGDLWNSATNGKADFAKTFILAFFKTIKDSIEGVAGLIEIIAGGIKGLSTGDFSDVQKGFNMIKQSGQDWINDVITDYGQKNSIYSNDNGVLHDKNGMIPSHIPTIGHTSFTGGSGIGLLAYDNSNASYGKKIYDLLYTYIPQLLMGIGIKFGTNPNGQSSFSLTDFSNKMNDFVSKAQSAAMWVNYSPYSAMYGNKTTNNSHTTQVSNSPTFNIYGANNPHSTAKVIDLSQNQLLTRAFKGVQV